MYCREGDGEEDTGLVRAVVVPLDNSTLLSKQGNETTSFVGISMYRFLTRTQGTQHNFLYFAYISHKKALEGQNFTIKFYSIPLIKEVVKKSIG